MHRRFLSHAGGWHGRDRAFRPIRKAVFSPGAKYEKRGNGKAAPQGGAVAPDSARAGMLEQQLRCPAHLIRSFGPLPDGSRPVKCIGMLHAPAGERIIRRRVLRCSGSEKNVERNRLRGRQSVGLLASDGIKNESMMSNFF
ncbi:hypothetical protein [Burkholderia sp. ABCPW 11]|nr:hypothetical protein [Burkholderia sp. ABCPW 11]